MIQYPGFYPDELFYSYLCRCYVRSGFLSYRDMADYLYPRKNIKPDIRFINPLNDIVRKTIGAIKPFSAISREHTMFPILRFEDQSVIENTYSLLSSVMDVNGTIKRIHNGNAVLRYCPCCAQEDRKLYGETYWHRVHQIDRLTICSKHRCYLVDTHIPLSKQATPGFYPAEIIIPDEVSLTLCDNEKLGAFAHYCTTVFLSDIPITAELTVNELLNAALNKEYLSSSGMTKDMNRIQKDFNEYSWSLAIQHSTIPEYLGKLYTGKNRNLIDVCLLAFFEKIPAELLSDPINWKAMIPMNRIYIQVADETGVSYDLVKQIGESVLNRYRSMQKTQRQNRRAEIKYAEMDATLLPRVKQVCKDLYEGASVDDRPHKVSIRSVEKALSLTQHRLDRLPQCNAEIIQWQESQAEYWARETVWAVGKIEKAGQILNWRHFRTLTNMRREDFLRCKEYLENYTSIEHAKRISQILTSAG